MAISPRILSRTTAVAAVLAGLIFAAVQIGHPPLDVTSVSTTEWTLRNTAKMMFAALALAGITGMYLRQVNAMGVLGLISYVVLSTGYLLTFSTTFLAGYVLPSLAQTAPAYVDSVLTAAAGGTAASDIGLMQYALAAQGITYLAGGLLFGVALYRARVLLRWGSALLAAGAVFTLSLSVLPESLYRFLAYPHSLALVALGYSLWRVAAPESNRAGSTGVTHTSPRPVGAP